MYSVDYWIATITTEKKWIVVLLFLFIGYSIFNANVNTYKNTFSIVST